jgi:GNAT superfamily N-acetyltransferase
VRLADIVEGSAELAIEVTDDHQGRGVARRLLDELRDVARALDVTTVTGAIQRDNEPARRLLRSVFPDARLRTVGGVVEFVAPVVPSGAAPAIDVTDVLADLGVPVAA